MKEPKLIALILARHGGRARTRLWRNATAKAWVGPFKRRVQSGEVVLGKGARPIQAGLCVGSPDIIGIHEGKFVAMEVKTGGGRVTKQQKRFLDTIERIGGGAIAGVVRSLEDTDKLLGRPE